MKTLLIMSKRTVNKIIRISRYLDSDIPSKMMDSDNSFLYEAGPLVRRNQGNHFHYRAFRHPFPRSPLELYRLSNPDSQGVRQTAAALLSCLQNVSVDHRGADILVTQEFLNRSNEIAAFHNMSGKRVPERMTSDALGDKHS